MAAKKTILITDDHREMREALAELLESEGYIVAEAENGREALAYCLAHAAPDLIVLNLEMPVMGGWELLAVLRCYQRCGSIPVLISSSTVLSGDARAVYPSLRQPFDAAVLLKEIERLLAVERPSFG